MSEPRKKNGRTPPSKVPTVSGQYATPSRTGRQTTEHGSPLPKAGRSTSLAVNRSRDETIDTPQEAGAAIKMVPRSVSVSFSTPSRHKRPQQERDLTNSDEKRKVRQEPPSKKHHKEAVTGGGNWKYKEYLHVGHHTNWPEIQVWGNVNGGGVLVLRAPKDKTPSHIAEKAWPQEFPLDTKQSSPSVALQFLQVKSGIAEFFKGDLSKATNETKRDLVTEYLAATWEGREVRIFTEESPGSALIKDILVGTHRHHGVNVYAFATNGVVRFRIHQQDDKHLLFGRKGVDFDDVAFHPAYQYDAPEETKAYILKELPCAEESLKADGTFSNDVDAVADRLSENIESTHHPESTEKGEDAQSIHTIGSDDTRIVVLGQEEDDGLSQALQDFEKAGKALKAEVLKREGAVLDRHDEVTREKERVALLEHSLQKKHQTSILANQEQSRFKTEQLNKWEKRVMESEDKHKNYVLAKQGDWKRMQTEFNEEQDRLKAMKKSLGKREEDLKKDRDDYDKRAQMSRDSLKERQTGLDQREAALNTKQKLLEEREKTFAEKERLIKLREVAVEKKERETGEKEGATVKSAPFFNLESPLKRVDTENTTDPPTAPLMASELSAKLDRTVAELAVYKNPYRLRFDPNSTFSKCFHEIPAGNPNAGMYTEITHATVQGKGTHQNKNYEHFRILQFPSLEVDGKLTQAGYEYDNHKYSVYIKDGKTKMVQDFEPGMIRSQDGRLLISWNCLKEKEQKFVI